MSDNNRRWLWRVLLFPFRLLGLFVIFLVLASAVAGVALRIAFTPDSLRSIVVTQLQEVFHSPVQIESARLSFFSGLRISQGLRVSGLRVLKNPGFPGQDFLTSDVVIAKLRLLPLLRRKIEISEFDLWSPKIEIVRREDGHWNVESLAGGRGAQGKVNFLVSEAKIKDGRVTIDDRLAGRRHVLEDVNLGLAKLDNESPSPFDLAFRGRFELIGGTVVVTGRGSGELSLGGGDPDRAAVEIKEADLHSGRLGLQVKGIIQGFRSPALSLAFSAGRASSSDLEPFLHVAPDIHLPKSFGTVQATFPSGHRLEIQDADIRSDVVSGNLKGFFDWSTPTLNWKLDIETAPFEFKRAPEVWERLATWQGAGPAQLSILARGGDEAGLDRFKLTLDDGKFSWLTMDFVHASFVFSATNNIDDAVIRVSSGTMLYHDQRLGFIRGAAAIKSRNLDIQSLEADWNGAPVSLRGKIDPLVRPDRFAVEGTLQTVQINDVVRTIQMIIDDMRAYKPSETPVSGWWLQVFKQAVPHGFPSLSGDLKLKNISHPNFSGKDGRLTWKLNGFSPGLRDLRGSVVVDWGPGSIRDVQGLMKSNVAYQVIFLPFTTMDQINKMGILNASQLENFEYAKIHGDYVFRSGNMTINNFWVSGDEMVATMDGEVDWPHETMDLHIATRVNHAKQGAAPETLSDERGRPCLAFYVDGAMLNPGVRLDMTKVPFKHFENYIDAGNKVSAGHVRKLTLELW